MVTATVDKSSHSKSKMRVDTLIKRLQRKYPNMPINREATRTTIEFASGEEDNIRQFVGGLGYSIEVIDQRSIGARPIGSREEYHSRLPIKERVALYGD
jgi:hypothetical protein